MGHPPGGWFQGWLDKWLEPSVLVNVILAALTFAVLVVYAFIFVAMMRQVGEMHDTAQATREAAEAARRSADVAVLAERPYLGVRVVAFARMDTPDRSATIQISNPSKSPAWPTRVLVHVTVDPAIDLQGKTPDYRENEADALGGIVTPNEHPGKIEESGSMLRLGDDQVANWKSGRGHLFFFGFIEYTDVGGQPHRASFAYRHAIVQGKDVYPIVNNQAFWNYY